MSTQPDDPQAPPPSSSDDADAARHGPTPPAVDPLATRYSDTPAQPDGVADPLATRYSDPPADPYATVYPPTPDAPGRTGRLPRRFGGYELLEEIGHGGMGVVYKARQLAPERLVALKVIGTGELAAEDDVRRFRREADDAARLDHPNIVPVYEVGEQDGLHFFTMKLIEGGSLNQHLERYRNDPKAAARLVATAALAVHYAHQRQLLHRDLKPGNILLDAAGQPHVADFGLAKRMGGTGEASQSQGVGTPEYMAPEQVRGESRLTTAADVYGLGGVLYALLTGRPPFRGDTPQAMMQMVLTQEPTAPSKVRPAVPRDMETICLKCLAKEPGRRYGSAEALAEVLERWLRREPIRARAVGTFERVIKWARRRPALAAAYGLLIAALVLGIGGGGAIWLWLRAEKARGDAVAARGDAETARRQAEMAKGDVEKARDELKKAHAKLIQVPYVDRIDLAQREWNAGDWQRARELLKDAGDLQEELTPGRRPWEWDYFNRVFHPELAVLEGHMAPLACVAFSPDGGRVATASWDHVARLWDAASGNQLVLQEGHTAPLESVCFSPDSRRVATASDDHTARLWDAASGEPLAVLEGHTNAVICVAFSPDGGPIVTGSSDKTARLWIARENPSDREKRREEQQQLWRQQQADAAEKAGQCFAAAFYLSRLIDTDAADPSLYIRRSRAYAFQGQGTLAVADFLHWAALRAPSAAP